MAKKIETQKFWLFVFVRTLANTLIMAGLVLTVMAFWPMLRTEVIYNWELFLGQKHVIKEDVPYVTEVKSSGFSGILASPPISIVPINTDFGIVIEKINVNAPVINHL